MTILVTLIEDFVHYSIFIINLIINRDETNKWHQQKWWLLITIVDITLYSVSPNAQLRASCLFPRCDFDSQRGTGSSPSITYFWSLGVLPVLLYHFCGSYVPVSVFNSSGSTPKSTIPFFWEHSHKSGIVSTCGSTPRTVKMQIVGVVG